MFDAVLTAAAIGEAKLEAGETDGVSARDQARWARRGIDASGYNELENFRRNLRAKKEKPKEVR